MSSATGIVFDRFLFFKNVAGAGHRVLMANYDGILAPLSIDRQHAFPYPTVAELLDSLMTTCNTRLVLLTSRPARELVPVLGLNPSPEIWGCSGFERLLPDGSYECSALEDDLTRALENAHEWLEHEGLGTLVARRPGGITVRWSDLPADKVGEAAAAARRTLWPFERHPRLHLAHFDGGLELRARTRDCSDVVREVLSEIPDDAVLAYLGNCLTEESAFRALADRGAAILVCREFRPTAAQLWLQPPDEVTAFLLDWISACGGVV